MDIMRRLSTMLTADVGDRVADISIVTTHIHEVVVTLQDYPVAPSGPMSSDMIERVRLALKAFEGLVESRE